MTKESDVSSRGQLGLPAASFTSCLARLVLYKEMLLEKMATSGSTMRSYFVTMLFSSSL